MAAPVATIHVVRTTASKGGDPRDEPGEDGVLVLFRRVLRVKARAPAQQLVERAEIGLR